MTLSRLHQRRLRAYYRSAGWPCLDPVEIDLLQAGLIERIDHGTGLHGIRVTASGLAAIATQLERNRGALAMHEALVAAVSRELAKAGRLVFRGLPLRAKTPEGWRSCRPDVYSLRNTTVGAYARPVVHEIKVRRADLQSDLADAGKRAAYQALSTEFHYVMPLGLARPEEIPEDCGVLAWDGTRLLRLRASPLRRVEPSIAEWMAIARRSAEPVDCDDDQPGLAP